MPLRKAEVRLVAHFFEMMKFGVGAVIHRLIDSERFDR